MIQAEIWQVFDFFMEKTQNLAAHTALQSNTTAISQFPP